MFLTLIEKRRCIRKYKDRPVEAEKLDRLIEAGLRAPSSRNRNPWELIAITDRAKLEALSRCKSHGAGFLKDAPLCVVVCGEEQRSDVWIEDCSIVSTFLLLAAESLGLGACWIQIRGRRHDDGRSAKEHVAEILDLPPELEVESIIAAGYPDEELPPRMRDELPFEKAHLDRFEKRPVVERKGPCHKKNGQV